MMTRPVTRLIVLLALGLVPSLQAQEDLALKLIDLARIELLGHGGDGAIVRAVTAQNRSDLSSQEIQSIDTAWKQGDSTRSQTVLDSQASQRLREIERSMDFVTLCFATDQRGAVVAMTERLERFDYGEDQAFVGSFNGGYGGIYTGAPAFSQAAQAYVVRVGVGVAGGEGAIGALIFEVDVDAFDRWRPPGAKKGRR